MLADAGPSTQRLLDVSVTSGGAAPRIATEAINERASQEALQVTATLDEILGSPQGVNTARSKIRTSTAPSRENAYRIAYAQPIDYSSRTGMSLENLLKRVPESAIGEANKLMRLEGESSRQILARVNDNGEVVFEQLPDVRQFDYITRALGDVAEAQNSAGKLGGTTQLGRATGNLQKLIRQQLRNAVPEYGTALDVAADAISRSRAIEAGADILKPSTSRETVRESLRGVSARNSATQQRTAIKGAVDEITAPGAINTLLSGEPVNATKRITQTLTGATPEARQVRQMGIYDEIADVLTQLKGNDAKSALNIIKNAVQGEALSEGQARIVSRALTSPSALALYGGGTNLAEGVRQQ